MLETRMWTYSVKNPDEILKNHKPVVKKQGPYVFDQVHKRKIHSIENNTVKYETFSYYFFNESKSCETCYLYNRVWIPNMIYQVCLFTLFYASLNFIYFRNSLKPHQSHQ